MQILCTNDDGYGSQGIEALVGVSKRIGHTIVVAPETEQSAMSNALTLHKSIRCVSSGENFIVKGTPADCVIMATNELIQGPIDLCLSGINHGANMGEDVLYSGTVAGAMEATLAGIPSLSVSYAGSSYDDLDEWDDVLFELITDMIRKNLLKENSLFNLNLPDRKPSLIKGVQVTSLGSRRYNNSITRCPDTTSEHYYQIGGGDLTWTGSLTADYRAIEDGYISITPVKLDLTDYSILEEISEWNIKL